MTGTARARAPEHRGNCCRGIVEPIQAAFAQPCDLGIVVQSSMMSPVAPRSRLAATKAHRHGFRTASTPANSFATRLMTRVDRHRPRSPGSRGPVPADGFHAEQRTVVRWYDNGKVMVTAILMESIASADLPPGFFNARNCFAGGVPQTIEWKSSVSRPPEPGPFLRKNAILRSASAQLALAARRPASASPEPVGRQPP